MKQALKHAETKPTRDWQLNLFSMGGKTYATTAGSKIKQRCLVNNMMNYNTFILRNFNYWRFASSFRSHLMHLCFGISIRGQAGRNFSFSPNSEVDCVTTFDDGQIFNFLFNGDFKVTRGRYCTETECKRDRSNNTH